MLRHGREQACGPSLRVTSQADKQRNGHAEETSLKTQHMIIIRQKIRHTHSKTELKPVTADSYIKEKAFQDWITNKRSTKINSERRFRKQARHT